MLAIRMQRTGRKGHANFRVVVQNSAQTPSSGRVVAQIGSYDPHSKVAVVDKEKASFYLSNGAQPSDRVAALLAREGVKLPDWVIKATKKSAAVRNPEKLRRNRPAEEVAEAPVEAEAIDTEIVAETPAEEVVSTTEATEEPTPEA